MSYIFGITYIVVILFNILELKRTTHWAPISIGAILSLAILVVLNPIFVILLLFLGIYRLIIRTILKIRHGKKFYGLLSGADTFHVVGKPSNFVTISCFMLRCEKYTAEEFYEICKQAILKTSVLKKFRALFCKSLGYSYLINQELDLQKDCLDKMKTLDCPGRRIDKQQFYELLNYHCNVPMPKDGKVPYQLLIGTQPVDWKNDDCDYYPIIFKIHHAVADGVALIKTFVALIADKPGVSKQAVNLSKSFKQDEKELFGKKLLRKFIDILRTIKTIILIFLLYPSLVVVYFTYKVNDTNVLHSTSLTHQKVIGTSSEENVGYVEKIKRIKKNIPGTTFPAVLIAAFTASLSDYFKKKCIELPQYITMSIPVVINAAEIRYLTPGDVTVDDTNLSNSYSLIFLKVPIDIEKIANNEKSEFPFNNQVINRLKLINKEIDTIKDSMEYQINHFFMQIVCAVLPQFFVKLILDTMHCTTVVSILAGPPNMTYYNGGLVLTDTMCWVPHAHNVGTSLGIITYDGRLHIGVNVDKALISDGNDVQRIIDDIYKYLDILEKEAEKHCNGNI